MDAEDAWVPYYDLRGIEITTVDDGDVATRMELTDESAAPPSANRTH